MINTDATMDLHITVFPKQDRRLAFNFPLQLKYFLPLLLIVYAFRLKDYKKHDYPLSCVIDDIKEFGYVNDDFDLISGKSGAIFHDGSLGLLAFWYDSDYTNQSHAD